MSVKCDCNDPECGICSARPSTGRTAFVDPYLEAKARATVKAAPAAPAVVVETPVVAQLAAGWTPPVEAQEETQRLLSTPIPAADAPYVPPVEQSKKQQTPFAAAYTAWQQECVKRKEWIKKLQADWKSAIAERDKAIAQWTAYVAAQRTAYEAATRTEPPAPPRKEQFPG